MTTNEDGSAWDLLAEPSRRAILTRLADRPHAVGELAAGLPISRPAVSQHLRVLKAAGLVLDEEQGTRRVYRLDPVAVTALRDQLDTFWDHTLAGFARAVTAHQPTAHQSIADPTVDQSTVDQPTAEEQP